MRISLHREKLRAKLRSVCTVIRFVLGVAKRYEISFFHLVTSIYPQ